MIFPIKNVTVECFVIGRDVVSFDTGETIAHATLWQVVTAALFGRVYVQLPFGDKTPAQQKAWRASVEAPGPGPWL